MHKGVNITFTNYLFINIIISHNSKYRVPHMKIKELSFLIILILTIGLLTPAAAATLKGSNLWDQEQGMSSTYTWTPAIYSGLWYDTDKGIYTENITLTISASDRQINSENAKYVTEYKPIPLNKPSGEVTASSAGKENLILPDTRAQAPETHPQPNLQTATSARF